MKACAVIASQRVRAEVPGPMTSSAKQSRGRVHRQRALALRSRKIALSAAACALAPTSVLNATTAANYAVRRKVAIITAPSMPTGCGASPAVIESRRGLRSAQPTLRDARYDL